MIIFIFFIVTINFHISFKLNFLLTTNFLPDVIIVRISQTYRLSWYWFFCLSPGTYTFEHCVKICYCINFRSWMKYFACCHCDDMLLGMLIPIPISVYLHITNILCFNNQFPISYNFSVNCYGILYCICLWCEHDNIKSVGFRVSCVDGSIFSRFN